MSIDLKEIERWIIKFANAKRKKEGLQPLRIDKNLVGSARSHSLEMVEANAVGHSEDAIHGLEFENVGNLPFKNVVTDPEIVAKMFNDNWINSSGHRENILNKKLNYIGVGVSKNGTTFFATQSFSESKPGAVEDHSIFSKLKRMLRG